MAMYRGVNHAVYYVLAIGLDLDWELNHARIAHAHRPAAQWLNDLYRMVALVMSGGKVTFHFTSAGLFFSLR